MKINVTEIAKEAEAMQQVLPWDLVLTIDGLNYETCCPSVATVEALQRAKSNAEMAGLLASCFLCPPDLAGIGDLALGVVAGAIVAELSKKKQAAMAATMQKHLGIKGPSNSKS
jgi:hypothetical protein